MTYETIIYLKWNDIICSTFWRTKPLAKIAVLFWCALNRSIYQISLTSLYSTIKERWRPGTRKVHGWNPVVSKKLFILNYQFKFVPKENCRKSGKMTFPFIFNHNSGKTKLKYDSVIGNAGKAVCKREKLWKTFQLFWCPKYEIYLSVHQGLYYYVAQCKPPSISARKHQFSTLPCRLTFLDDGQIVQIRPRSNRIWRTVYILGQ